MWTLGGQWTSYTLQLTTGIVLARLLDPRAFGIVAMALTATVLVDQFRTLGLSQAVVQSDTLTDRQVSALFWVNAGVGLVLASAMVPD